MTTGTQWEHAKPVRLALIGGTGWIGSEVGAELARRGHEVVLIQRDLAKEPNFATFARISADILDGEAVARAIADCDAVLSAYAAPDDAPEQFSEAAHSLLAAARNAGVRRVIWIGGAGSLRVAGGDGDVVDQPDFPEGWKPSALAQRDVLRLFREAGNGLHWTYVSPAAMIEDGPAGVYRTGADELLVDFEGASRITTGTFAVALADLVESGAHSGERVTFAA